MLLAIDIGNTHSVIGIYKGKDKLCGWRVSTVKWHTSDELRICIQALLSSENINPKLIRASCMCCVVPRLQVEWTRMLNDLIGTNPLVCDAKTTKDIFPCTYPRPWEIGQDSISDSIAAVERYGAPAIVFDFGTATNISIINKNGEFVGGIISPGVETGAAALFSRATQITSTALEAPQCVIGYTTDEAVKSGIVFGEAGRVDGLVKKIHSELGYPARVIATGGLSHAISNHATCIDVVDQELTLEGLRIMHEKLA